MKPHSVSNLLREGSLALKETSSSAYVLEAQILLGHVLQRNKTWLLTHPEQEVGEQSVCKYHLLLAERSRGKPIQYIVRHCEFMSLDFYVDENVLIPRPDTETLTEKAIALIGKSAKKTTANQILELCCGSGCIAVALAHYCGHATVTAVDISRKALEIAKKNAVRHGVDNQITWIESDLFTSIGAGIQYSMILSNPPYISTSTLSDLMPSVKDFEPALALDGGSDGLDFYRRIIKESPSFLAPGGHLLFEIGYDQGSAVKSMMKAAGYKDVEILKDLAGHDRVVYNN